mmetsp:Transcript_13469/g.26866  ORF Transcript_13469/g.26866 Transcript_13469/m.26866 type:complete len:80 (+) Transcript_13469:552-791(+)
MGCLAHASTLLLLGGWDHFLKRDALEMKCISGVTKSTRFIIPPSLVEGRYKANTTAMLALAFQCACGQDVQRRAPLATK